MKKISTFLGQASWLMAFLAVVSAANVSYSAIVPFCEDFSGPVSSPWNAGGWAGGHPATVAGTYDITNENGNGGTKLTYNPTGGTVSAYSHSIDLVLTEFTGTGADIKFKSFGPDGFMEVVLNSFGDMRIFQGGVGNIQPNTNIGIADGDALNITTNYDDVSDTITVTYAINGGGDVTLFSGGAPIGNLITNFVEFELFEFGAGAPTPSVSIDSWKLTAVPEPNSLILMAISGLWVFCGRRSR